MGLIQIDVISIQALERCVTGFHNVLARQATIILSSTSWEVDLCKKFVGLSTNTFKRLCEYYFCLGACIYICCIESCDSLVQCFSHTFNGRFSLYLGSVSDPVSIRDFRDIHTGTAKASIFHIDTLGISVVSCQHLSAVVSFANNFIDISVGEVRCNSDADPQP